MPDDEPSALYVREGETFVPTAFTRGPWSADAQHAGPPAALAGRAIEGFEPTDRMRVARFTLEVLRPIPLVPLAVAVRVVRPGKLVQLVEATVSDGQSEVARANAWRIRVDEGDGEGGGLPATGTDEPPPFPGPDASPALPVYEPGWRPNYFDAIDWRFARGGVFEPGPATCWMRMRLPLVEGETPSPLVRVLVAADSGNGVSATLAFDRFLFINVDLSVHLARGPAGEWVCLDAVTRTVRDGVGFAEAELWDEHGRIGASAQSLLVARR